MSRVSDLLIAQGDANARARAASGAIWGNAIESIGQIPGQVADRQRQANQFALLQSREARESASAAQEQQLTGMKIATARDDAAAQQTIAQLVKQHTSTDPDTGHLVTDHDAVARGLPPKYAHAYLVDAENDQLKINSIQSSNLGLERDKGAWRAGKLGAVLQAPEAEQPARYAVLRGTMTALGQGDPVLGKLPEQFDPAAVRALYDAQLSDKDRYEQAFKASETRKNTAAALKDEAEARSPKPTEAGLNAEQQRILAKPEAERTLAEVASANAYNERVSGKETITVKTMENGRPVEKVMTKAEALKAGVFPSQPPASVQLLNAPPPPAQPPSKAEIAMAHYMVPTPSPRSFATPAGKAMMDRILTENPDFDASKYSVRAPTRKAFTTGVQGQQLTAMNTAVEHLDQLQQAADALDNGTFTPANKVWQSLKETFGSNAPTNYDTIKAMVDKEVEAVANKGVPTVSGTAEQKALANKKAAPGQIQGYINTLIPLMGSKVNALHYQYRQAMGENDPFDPLTPEAKAILVKRGFDPSAAPGARSAPLKIGGFTVVVK